MEKLTRDVTDVTGLEPSIAKAAIGHVLLFLRNEAPEGHIAEFIDKMPKAHEAVEAAAASGDGGVTVTCLAVRPGGTIGTHPATGDQLFLVIAGSGWAAGADGIRHPIQAGQGVHWTAGEVHTSGTDTSLTALAVEGSSLRLFEPEHS